MYEGTSAGAWGDAVERLAVDRTQKPRRTGLTMVIDKGLGLGATDDLLQLAADHIDFIKLAFGTSVLYPVPVLQAKIRLIRSFGVKVYPGGTLLELAGAQGRVEAFVERAAQLGFTAIEVSEGTVALPAAERDRRIRLAKEAGLDVVTEVGKKDKRVRLQARDVVRQAASDLEAGAQWIIVEGRDSGKGVGVYDDDGEPREEIVEAILRETDQPDVLMWEAPLIRQQQYWLNRLGINVNLGNVQPWDVLTLEATRTALRGDTLRKCLESEMIGISLRSVQES